jgi:uncharacterized protein (DUF983 family)
MKSTVWRRSWTPLAARLTIYVTKPSHTHISGVNINSPYMENNMSQCPECGGDLIGDGYTAVIHCESLEEEVYYYAAPDEGPFYCKQE